MTTSHVRRRGFRFTAVAVAGTFALAACNSGPEIEGPAEGAASVDLDEAYDVGETPREELQDGGQVTLSVGALGPDWDLVTGLADINFVLESQYNVGAWNVDAVGEYVLHEDYFVSAEQEVTEDGTQILHYELNPDAVWNDGTPIDFHSYEHTASIRSGADEAYDLGDTHMYDQIESIEMGQDEYSFTVTMESMYQPWQTLFESGIIHPDVNTPDLFNDGFVDDIRPDWRAGPFILDIHDRSANVVSVVPNPNWWGDEPVLDRINFVQYESGAELSGFQNGQIDRVSISNIDRYSELASWSEEGYEVRRGLSPGGQGYIFNVDAPQVADVEVRRAIFQAIDREQLNDIRFQGLNWEADLPGSWLAMPFDDRYQDNYPVEDADPEGARQTLIEAGWEGEEGILTQDGEELSVALTTFGDDPLTAAVSQAFQTQMREAGIDLEIDNRGGGQFGEVIGERDFVMMGIGLGLGYADPTNAVNARFGQVEYNLTAAGDDELDARIAEVTVTEDLDERLELAIGIERDHISTYFTYLNTHIGPQIYAFREGLANIGPNLYETMDWTILGWREDVEHDGTDTGEDPEELEDSGGE